MKIHSVTQVITEVQVFRDVTQSLRSFKISFIIYQLKRRSISGDLDIQNETHFTVHENRRNIDGPSKIWMYVCRNRLETVSCFM